MRTASLSLVLLVGVLASCAEDDRRLNLPPTEGVYESELTRLRAEPGLPLCAGTGPRMDQQARFIAETLDMGDISSPLSFYWLTRDGLDMGVPSCAGFLGCVSRGGAYTTRVPHTHEAVHLYLADRFGVNRHFLFEEGMAEVFSTDSQDAGLPERDVWDVLLENQVSIDLAGRHRAGHFLRAMMDVYPKSDVEDFYRRTTGVIDVDRVLDAYAEAFGEELEEFLERYEEMPVCEQRGGFELAVECDGGEPTDAYDDDGRTLVERTLSCGEPGTFNFDAEYMATTFTIEIPDFQLWYGRIHHLEVVGEGVVAQLYGCQGCGEPFAFDSREGAFWEAIPPGRYWGRFLVPIDQPGSAGLRIIECASENLC